MPPRAESGPFRISRLMMDSITIDIHEGNLPVIAIVDMLLFLYYLESASKDRTRQQENKRSKQ